MSEETIPLIPRFSDDATNEKEELPRDTPRDTPRGKHLNHLVLLTTTLLRLADTTAIFLPAVVSRSVSCEFDLPASLHHASLLVLYVTMATMTPLTIPLALRYGRRRITMVGVALALGTTTIGVYGVVSYPTLLLHRFVQGATVAANMTTHVVYLVEVVHGKRYLVWSVTVISLAYTAAGMVLKVLAVFVLDVVMGWRDFTIITTAPFYLTALVVFLCWLPPEDVSPVHRAATTTNIHGNMDVAMERIERQFIPQPNPPSRSFMIGKVVELCLYCFLQGITYNSAVFLIPATLKWYETSTLSDISTFLHLSNSSWDATPAMVTSYPSPECHVTSRIHGMNSLLIAVTFGASNLTGKAINYIALHGRFSTAFILLMASILSVLSTAITCAITSSHEGHNFAAVLVLCAAGTQLFLGASSAEVFLACNDPFFFTPRFLMISSGLRGTVFTVTIVIANVINAVLPVTRVIMVHLWVSAGALLLQVICYAREVS